MLYGLMVLCREVISRKCCEKSHEWLYSSKMGMIQRPLRLKSKRGLCTKRAETCDVSGLASSNYNLACVNDEGKTCQIVDNQVDINCQCKVRKQ